MHELRIRKIVTAEEEIFHEGGPVAKTPLRRAAVLTVLQNPFSGRYEPDIAGFMDALKPLGVRMAAQLIQLLGGDATVVEGYGKGALIGTGGEVEHGALWHAPGGYVMRAALGDARAIVPSAKKVAGAGARLDVPITHINASYVRSHLDTMEVGISDAPRTDELVYVLVMTTGGRIHNRAGGLRAGDIIGQDGLK